MRNGRHLTVIVEVDETLPEQEITSGSNIDQRVGIDTDSSGRTQMNFQEADRAKADYN